MAPAETQDPETVLDTGSSTGSYVAQPDHSFWPYGDLMEHIDHSFAEVGQFSLETDLSQLGSGLDREPMTAEDMAVEAAVEATLEVTAGQETAEEANISLDFATLVVQLDCVVRSQDGRSLASLQRLYPRLLTTEDHGILNPESSNAIGGQVEDTGASEIAADEDVPDTFTNTSSGIITRAGGTSNTTLLDNSSNH